MVGKKEVKSSLLNSCLDLFNAEGVITVEKTRYNIDIKKEKKRNRFTI
jgi:hypothetical protein